MSIKFKVTALRWKVKSDDSLHVKGSSIAVEAFLWFFVSVSRFLAGLLGFFLGSFGSFLKKGEVLKIFTSFFFFFQGFFEFFFCDDDNHFHNDSEYC
jgi:hypothetical protein